MADEKYYFYRYSTRASDKALKISLPEGYEFKVFVPRWPVISPAGLPPGFGMRIFRVWWLMRTFGMFRNRDGYRVYTIYKDLSLAHYSVLLPWHRKYSFMAKEDFEIGPIGTLQEHRRLGLAASAIAYVKKEHAESGCRLWYIVRAANEPSVKLIEKCGFERYAIGRRDKSFGLRALGRFRIESVLV